jgi:Gas vesicle synthesis protein GvpL/GvpF
VRQQKGIYVYGILPDDIEVTGDTPGVGEHPGLLRDVRFDGLVALISDVDISGRLGSPEDLRAYREILDATAAEVPLVPLSFGTILTSEDAVAEELLAARHDEFTAALERLEGRAEFQVKGRYVKGALLERALSQNNRAARLHHAAEGNNPEAARTARIELDQLISEAVTAWREQDTRALRHVMERVCVASVAREPAGEMDAVNVAFLVDVNEERTVERVIEALAREWEGRIDLQVLGPMAAYDFTGPAQPER